jgi:hypothetical protein
MSDKSTYFELFSHTVVSMTQPLVSWATTVNGQGTRTRDICQSRNPIHALIVTDSGTSGGICDAASGEWIRSNWGYATDPTIGLQSGASFDAGTVRSLQAIQNTPGSAFRRVAADCLGDPTKGVTSNPTVINLIVNGNGIFRTQYSVLLEFNFRGGAQGGHSTAAYRNGNVIEYFDINYGLYVIPRGEFDNWFWWYMSVSGYNISFGSIDVTLFKPQGRI